MLRIRADDFGTILTPEGVTYQAVEVVFHTPSDHTFGGMNYDFEIQILHKAVSEGDIGKKALLSILVNYLPSSNNTFFDNFEVTNLPTFKDPERTLSEQGLDINELFQSQANKEMGSAPKFS